MTIKKLTTDLNKTIGKPYTQQFGRQSGKGTGHILIPGSLGPTPESGHPYKDTKRKNGLDREEAINCAWGQISNGPSPDRHKLERVKGYIQEKFGIDYSEAHRIVDDAVYLFEQEGGKVKGSRD
jgi:hypothetical protein